MGVDIATYRKRIGSIHHGKESDVSTVQFSVNGNDVLRTLGAVAFIGILLVISGIEQNPGPGLKEVAASVALVGIFISILKGLDFSWKTYIPVMVMVMVTCYLVSQSKLWKRYFRINENIEVEKDTTKTKVPPEDSGIISEYIRHFKKLRGSFIYKITQEKGQKDEKKRR